MYIGEYRHTIDNKGRIIIPAKYREVLGPNFYVTRGIENCLYVYDEEHWNDICSKLESLPFTKKDARAFIRFFASGAAKVEIDNQGRINIPSHLINYANLLKNCVIIGAGARCEIWSEEKFDDYYESTKDDMSDIAENLFDESVN